MEEYSIKYTEEYVYLEQKILFSENEGVRRINVCWKNFRHRKKYWRLDSYVPPSLTYDSQMKKTVKYCLGNKLWREAFWNSEGNKK